MPISEDPDGTRHVVRASMFLYADGINTNISFNISIHISINSNIHICMNIIMNMYIIISSLRVQKIGIAQAPIL